MSNYRIEIAVPKKGARVNWPTHKLTPDHCEAAFMAIMVGLYPNERKGPGMTRHQKRLARNVAEALIEARSEQRAFDWLDAEGVRLAKVKADRNAKRRKARNQG